MDQTNGEMRVLQVGELEGAANEAGRPAFRERVVAFNTHVNFLALGLFINACSSMMIYIMPNFTRPFTTDASLVINIFFLLTTLLQLTVSFWCMAMDKERIENRFLFKLQALLLILAAALKLIVGTSMTLLTREM